MCTIIYIDCITLAYSQVTVKKYFQDISQSLRCYKVFNYKGCTLTSVEKMLLE